MLNVNVLLQHVIFFSFMSKKKKTGFERVSGRSTQDQPKKSVLYVETELSDQKQMSALNLSLENRKLI